MTNRLNVLVVGGGGREHALAWKIAQSPLTKSLWIAPGNAGTQDIALAHGGVSENLPISATDIDGLLAACRERPVDFVVIGPDDPLAMGLADRLRAEGLAAFGPSQAAAKLEWSKSFAKDFMARHAIPTARHHTFDAAADAINHVDHDAGPYVIKADGLAAGKGVVITPERAKARAEIQAMIAGKHGKASQTIVIEEFMSGQEASVFAICDGQDFVVLPACQDHKAAFDGDKGPNTGGMGAYCPTPVVDDTMMTTIIDTIIRPTFDGMRAEGPPFSGVLYVGLMLTSDGPKVVEYNARFGDPECQVLMARMTSDVLPLLYASATGAIAGTPAPTIDPRPAVTVVLATDGYPQAYEKGSAILGVERANAMEDVIVFHAGTQLDGEGVLRANGGRMLNVTALGETLAQAVERAYNAIDLIEWPEGFYRRDIAWRALQLGASSA